MKVKDLIEELKKRDPEAMVVVDGYEFGVDELQRIIDAKVILDVNTKGYAGRHEIDPDGETIVVHLPRNH